MRDGEYGESGKHGSCAMWHDELKKGVKYVGVLREITHFFSRTLSLSPLSLEVTLPLFASSWWHHRLAGGDDTRPPLAV